MPYGLFVGLCTIDVIYGVDEFPAANTKIAANSQEVYAGGPATNACITFAHLGGSATLVTAVGNHPLASVVTEELKKYSVNLVDLNPGFEGVPPISSVSVDSTGRRNVVSANASRIPVPSAEVDLNLCKQAGIVLVDGHCMQACQAWAQAARAVGTPVVLDGGSWKCGTESLLEFVDTAICSADFLPPGCISEDDVTAFLKHHRVANIAITRGALPLLFVSTLASGIIPVPTVEVVDTMGAGDVFHGAYCYFASLGLGFEEALAQAAKVSSESCRYHGARGWMRHNLL